MHGQCRKRRRWNIDKWPENKTQKEKKLEEFRSYRTSKRRKRRNKEVTQEKKLKPRIVLYMTRNSIEKLSNQVVIETERKRLVENCFVCDKKLN